jgi:hypothetical protein
MIDASRFIETSDNRREWLAARLPAVTATEVAKAATPSGFNAAVAERRHPTEIVSNGYMQFGSDNEEWIARDLKTRYGVMPNRWLIASADNTLHMATPDGLSLDHTRMAEIKTGGTEPNSPPIAHVRQMAWQFRCNEFAQEIVYAFILRRESNGVFVAAWMEPKVWIIHRDEAMISELITVADRLLDATTAVAA